MEKTADATEGGRARAKRPNYSSKMSRVRAAGLTQGTCNPAMPAPTAGSRRRGNAAYGPNNTR
eukprot:scaffold6320_cov126-Isochrysis_galbana.AAC.2